MKNLDENVETAAAIVAVAMSHAVGTCDPIINSMFPGVDREQVCRRAIELTRESFENALKTVKVERRGSMS